MMSNLLRRIPGIRGTCEQHSPAEVQARYSQPLSTMIEALPACQTHWQQGESKAPPCQRPRGYQFAHDPPGRQWPWATR